MPCRIRPAGHRGLCLWLKKIGSLFLSLQTPRLAAAQSRKVIVFGRIQVSRSNRMRVFTIQDLMLEQSDDLWCLRVLHSRDVLWTTN